MSAELPLDTPHFRCEPDPENPGWLTWELVDQTRFNALTMGKLIVRRESETSARLRMFPTARHSNLGNNVHGGVTLSLIDISLFAAARIAGVIEVGAAVTLDLSTQFIGAGRIDEPLDAVAEVLRETGRMVFVRGLVMQGAHLVASFSGTVRKPATRKA